MADVVRRKEKKRRDIAVRIAVAISATVFGMFLISCGGTIERTPGSEILVDPQWVADNIDGITLLDTGRSLDDYLAGHIPGAVLADRSIAWSEVDGVPGMLPDTLAADLAELGVSNGRPVVIYDAGNGLWAARLFWALEYLGHGNVHILNRGLAGWVADGFESSFDAVIPVVGDFEADIQNELIADARYVEDALDSERIVVIDTRSGGEYDGSDVRAERGGRIPGSVHLEWTENLNDSGGFKLASQLDGLYQAVLDSDGEAITLCQTGVRGAHSYVALRIAGYQNVRLYDGSWAEWGNDPDLPVES